MFICMKNFGVIGGAFSNIVAINLFLPANCEYDCRLLWKSKKKPGNNGLNG